MTPSIEARDFSPDQTNRQAKLDTSTNQPTVDNSHHWEHPRICATCTLLEPFHEHDGVMYYTCPHAPAEYACITDPHHRACTSYQPKHTD